MFCMYILTPLRLSLIFDIMKNDRRSNKSELIYLNAKYSDPVCFAYLLLLDIYALAFFACKCINIEQKKT